MSHTSLSLHNIVDLRVTNYFPGNSRSVGIDFIDADNVIVHVDIYGLPEDSAIALVTMLGGDRTPVRGEGTGVTFGEYINTKGVFDAIEGRGP